MGMGRVQWMGMGRVRRMVRRMGMSRGFRVWEWVEGLEDGNG